MQYLYTLLFALADPSCACCILLLHFTASYKDCRIRSYLRLPVRLVGGFLHPEMLSEKSAVLHIIPGKYCAVDNQI